VVVVSGTVVSVGRGMVVVVTGGTVVVGGPRVVVGCPGRVVVVVSGRGPLGGVCECDAATAVTRASKGAVTPTPTPKSAPPGADASPPSIPSTGWMVGSSAGTVVGTVVVVVESSSSGVRSLIVVGRQFGALATAGLA
jgi:hypothetical protein